MDSLLALVNVTFFILAQLCRLYQCIDATVKRLLEARTDAKTQSKARRYELTRRQIENQVRRAWEAELQSRYDAEVEARAQEISKDWRDSLGRRHTSELKWWYDREHELCTALEMKRALIRKLSRENAGLHEQNRGLRNSALDRDQKVLAQKLAELNSEKENLQVELDRRNQELSELRQLVDYNQCMLTNNQLKEAQDGIQRLQALREAEAAKAMGEQENLRAELDRRTQELSELWQLASNHQCTSTNDIQLKEAQDEIQRLQALRESDMAQGEEGRQADRALYDEWYSQNVILYNQMAQERDQLAAQLSTGRNATQRELEKIKLDKDQLARERDQVAGTSEQYKMTLSQTEARLSDIRRELEQVKLDQNKVTRERDQLAGTLEQYQMTLGQMEGKFSDTQRELEQIKFDQNKITQERDQLAGTSEQYQMTIGQMQAKLSETQCEVEKIKLDQNQTARLIQNYQQRQKYLDNRNYELEKARRELEDTVQSLNSAINSSEDRKDNHGMSRKPKGRKQSMLDEGEQALAKLSLAEAPETTDDEVSDAEVDHEECEKTAALWKAAYELEQEEYANEKMRYRQAYEDCLAQLEVAQGAAACAQDKCTSLEAELEKLR